MKRDPKRTRETILCAATNEFAAHGINGARIDKIARRSGSNKRMIYHYFGDKQRLYIEVLDHAFDKMRVAEHSIDFSNVTPMEGIEIVVRFIWRFFLENPEVLTLLSTESLTQAGFLGRSPTGWVVNHRLVWRLQALILQGVEEGIMRRDVDALDVFLTIVSMSFFYLSNRYMLSAIFNKHLQGEIGLTRWEKHIILVVCRSLV